LDNNQWQQANYPYDFIMHKYKESIQYLNNSMRGCLPNLPEKLTDRQLEIFAGLIGTETVEGLYILNALSQVRDVEGDVCEYGVAQGATSTLIADTISDLTKDLYLFDSFQGLPKPTVEDELKDDIFNLGNMAAYEGTMNCHPNECVYRLQKMGLATQKIKMVAGFVDETIDKTPDKVSFAFVDFDFYLPIKIALDCLHNKLSSGGVIIVDDYDFFSTGVKKAVSEFLSDKEDYKFTVADKSHGNFCILERL
jgi:O-methyltransferase